MGKLENLKLFAVVEIATAHVVYVSDSWSFANRVLKQCLGPVRNLWNPANEYQIIHFKADSVDWVSK